MSESLINSQARRARIEEAVGLLQDYPFVSNLTMRSMLEGLGYDGDTSMQLVAYVPLAYFRMLLERKSVSFPPTCTFYNQHGESWPVVLLDQQIYADSCEFARGNLARGMQQEHIQAIIRRSCEFPQVNTQLAEGVAPDALVLEPGEYGVDGDIELTEADAPTSPWWKFW